MEKEGSLLKNSIYNVIYKLLNIVFPMIMSIYGGYIIFSEGLGKVAAAQNKMQYFLLVASLGIPEYGIREIAKRRNQKEEKNKVFSELFLLNAISTFFCFLAFYIFSFSMDWFGEKKLFLIVGITIILNFFNVDWLYQGEENFKFITIRSLVVKTLSLISLFLLVRSEKDYSLYALANVLAIAGNYIFNIVHLRKIGIRLSFKDLKISRHLKPVFVLLCTTVSIELYTLLDTTMITHFCEYDNVAYYTYALKIPKMVIVAVTGISGVLLPKLSRYYQDGNIEKCNEIISNIFSVLLFIFIPCGVGLMIVAPDLMPQMYGPTFIPAVKTLQISSLLIYALGFSNLFGTQLLLTVGEEKKLFISTVCGAVINIILNLILIPKFAQNGATVASVISETAVTILTMSFSLKYFKLKLNIKGIVISVVSCILMGCACFFAERAFNSYILSLIVTVATGFVLYTGLNFVLKNPIFVYLINLRKRG